MTDERVEKEGQKHEQSKLEEEVEGKKETVTVKNYKILEHLKSLKKTLVISTGA